MIPVSGSGSPPRCAVPGCAVPYVVRHAVDAGQSVSLCLAHAEQAVAAAVPRERLHALSQAAPPAGGPRRAERPWQQRKVLTRVAGNFFYETPVVFRLGSITCVGLERDGDGNVVLELRMPTASGQRRARMTANVWETPPTGAEVRCPPSGRLLDIAYPGGDRFRIELVDIHTSRALQARYGNVARWAYRLDYPVTLAEVTMAVANTDLTFTPDDTCIGGPTTVDCFTSHVRSAIDIPLPYDQLVGLFPY